MGFTRYHSTLGSLVPLVFHGWNPNMERRSLPNFTLDLDGSLHQANQAVGDGQAHACALIFTGHGAIHLSERIKDYILILRRNTYSCVLDGKMREQPAIYPLRPCLDGDTALFSKLNGVGQQVMENLAQPARV